MIEKNVEGYDCDRSGILLYLTRSIVNALITVVSFVYLYDILTGQITGNLMVFMSLVGILCLIGMIGCKWKMHSINNKNRVDHRTDKIVSVLFNILLVLPGIINGNPWLFFGLTNSIVCSYNYAIVAIVHLFSFLVCWLCPGTELSHILRLYPIVVSIIALMEYVIVDSKTECYQKNHGILTMLISLIVLIATSTVLILGLPILDIRNISYFVYG
ncbi:hypothetical protein NEOKW01_0132 [Nematocida sp. AWRm80]|nr:hypothetical protein NEOKW01_0132 [Nematocida sp. AWRm80]